MSKQHIPLNDFQLSFSSFSTFFQLNVVDSFVIYPFITTFHLIKFHNFSIMYLDLIDLHLRLLFPGLDFHECPFLGRRSTWHMDAGRH